MRRWGVLEGLVFYHVPVAELSGSRLGLAGVVDLRWGGVHVFSKVDVVGLRSRLRSQFERVGQLCVVQRDVVVTVAVGVATHGVAEAQVV